MLMAWLLLYGAVMGLIGCALRASWLPVNRKPLGFVQCTCPARCVPCECHDAFGTRNPRGAGRGRCLTSLISEVRS